MSDTMGTFRIEVEFANPLLPGRHASLQGVLVDTGAELSWFPAAVLELLGIERQKEATFRQANGTILTRFTGFAIIYAAGTRTIDEVVFGEAGDLVLLGARTLEGLNVRIDPVAKTLVDAGPAPAATAA